MRYFLTIYQFHVGDGNTLASSQQLSTCEHGGDPVVSVDEPVISHLQWLTGVTQIEIDKDSYQRITDEFIRKKREKGEKEEKGGRP